ncbi:MAG TPA: MmgE/PrpD family protein [Burkholderiales bacterium]|nr:MmgE/PrpD family protein [Burkholderiales bacterium]
MQTERAPLTSTVARFASSTRYADLPADVVRLSKSAVLDCLAVAFAGCVAEGSVLLRRHLAQFGFPRPNASVIGSDLRLPAQFAALANGNSMHSDDYDDTHNPSRIHPSASVAAALFAAAEAADASGRDLLSAFNVGVEASCKISMATAGAHYGRGFHSSGTISPYGAAAAVCNVRQLPYETTLAALGIAGSQSAGVRENFGTMTKPLHAGRAGESGVMAADLAASGFTSSPTILEGERGFFTAYSDKCDANVILDTLGKPWTFATEASIGIKPFPSGRLTHPGMCELEKIVLAQDIKPAQVERIHVKTNRQLPGNLTYHRPVAGLEGKFSMEFCLASMLVLRRAGLAEFTDECVNRPEIQDAISQIEYTCYSDEEAAANQYPLLTTFIEVVMKDGRRFTGRADYARGSPPQPMTFDEVADKLRGGAQFARWDHKKTEQIIAIVRGLEHLKQFSELAALLHN